MPEDSNKRSETGESTETRPSSMIAPKVPSESENSASSVAVKSIIFTGISILTGEKPISEDASRARQAVKCKSKQILVQGIDLNGRLVKLVAAIFFDKGDSHYKGYVNEEVEALAPGFFDRKCLTSFQLAKVRANMLVQSLWVEEEVKERWEKARSRFLDWDKHDYMSKCMPGWVRAAGGSARSKEEDQGDYCYVDLHAELLGGNVQQKVALKVTPASKDSHYHYEASKECSDKLSHQGIHGPHVTTNKETAMNWLEALLVDHVHDLTLPGFESAARQAVFGKGGSKKRTAQREGCGGASRAKRQKRQQKVQDAKLPNSDEASVESGYCWLYNPSDSHPDPAESIMRNVRRLEDGSISPTSSDELNLLDASLSVLPHGPHPPETPADCKADCSDKNPADQKADCSHEQTADQNPGFSDEKTTDPWVGAWPVCSDAIPEEIPDALDFFCSGDDLCPEAAGIYPPDSLDESWSFPTLEGLLLEDL